jgi:hypothetical protein
MGNLFSNGKSKKLSAEEEQQQMQQQYGVLIPPIFTVSQDDGYIASTNDNVPISTQAQWYSASSPNLVDSLWRLTAGYNLLTEYMSPGIYFAGTCTKFGRGGQDRTNFFIADRSQ